MADDREKMNIMFTCIGRRVSLLKSFRRAARRVGVQATFFGTDMDPLSPALQLCDGRFIAPAVKNGGYIYKLLDFVRQNDIHLLIPTTDLDLKDLADNKARFKEVGCTVLISEPGVVELGRDKRRMAEYLLANGFDTPETITIEEALSRPELTFPRYLKPWDGSASKGNAIVNDREELEFFGRRIPNCIVQEYLVGTEYTCDAFVDFNMKVRCVVPRKRIEVRGGEVSKGVTEKNTHIMESVRSLTELLGAGPGLITIQVFLCGDKVRFIEINPRFGGGAPLSIKAGADSPRWILEQLTGIEPKIRFDGFKDGLHMLRWDSEVWYRREE